MGEGRVRERLAWSVAVGVVAILALRLPGSRALREDDLSFTRPVSEIQREISLNYVDAVDKEKLREAAINGMIANLDPYSEYVPPREETAFNEMMEGTFKGIGIELAPREDGVLEVLTPIDDTPAAKAGLAAGDVILKVDDVAIAGMPPGEVINKRIKGPDGTTVKLTVQRVTGEMLNLTVTRSDIVRPSVKGFDRNPDNSWNYIVLEKPRLAYVRLTGFTGHGLPVLEPLLKKLVEEKMEGLILDLRNNPGGMIDEAAGIADLFLDKGTIVTTRGRNRPEQSYFAHGEGTLPPFPMAVLVNGQSASASEILSGALSDNRRAVIVGSRTFGKGCFQEPLPLGKDGLLKLTVGYYYLPSGRLLHRTKDATVWGVDPTIPVVLSPEAERDLWAGRLATENFRRPTTRGAAAGASTRPGDPQLKAAMDALVAEILMGERKKSGV